MKETRKLNTILFADIAGYTSIMHSNEAKAMEYLQNFKKLLEDKVSKYEGHIVQYFGDACLLSFDSATSGVQCAISLQKDFQEINLPIRIGMHLGEVVFTDNNVFGDGVNLASRIESMGIPGSVLLSSAIRNQIKNKQEFKLTTLGTFEFKNVPEPIEVFALENNGLSVPVKSKIQGKFKEPSRKPNKVFQYLGILALLVVAVFAVQYFIGSGSENKEPYSDETLKKNIAVLPLINLNAKSEGLDYFSDGVTREIIDELAKINSIVVSAFSTTYPYKNQEKSHSEIAAELGAKYLISGSSQIFDNNKRVKLTIELIDPFTNTRLWNSTFDEELNDAPSIQLAVAKNVAENLNIELTVAERNDLETPNTKSGEAFRLFLQAQAEINKLSLDGFENGTNYLEEAIKLDPNYGQAHTLLAWRYTVGASGDLIPGNKSTQESVALAMPFIVKAFELDSNSSDTYLVRANLKLYSQNKIQEAKEDVDKAISINSWPKIPTNYCICTVTSTYIALGNIVEAKKYGQLAKKVDPGHALFDWDNGNVEMMDGNYDQAQYLYDIAVKKADIPLFNSFLGLSYYYNEQYEEALKYLIKAYENSPLAAGMVVATLSNTYLRMGDNKTSELYFKELMDRDAAGEHHLNLFIADIYLERNDIDKALDFLEQGVENTDWGFAVFLSLIPKFKTLEGEPRFQEIRKKIQFKGD
ncbi:MAG: adenylate/guanylate cyclase domain-containing protein [Eudoraea sp.]|uniref:adenylate/guanylate cyclase domain-containing protein n=1 Tax=Eudoraea sp. TaxID=1979955 RepID=UPI003C715B33